MTSLRPTAGVARGATYLFIQGFLNAIIGLVYFIVLAHVLANRVDEMGIYTLLSFILASVPVFGTLALNSAAVKYISQFLAQNDLEKARAVVSRVLQVSLFASVVVFFALFIPAEWWSTKILGTASYALLLRILALCAVSAIFNAASSSFLQGMQRIWQVAAIGLGYTVIQSVVGISLLLLGWRLTAVVLGWLAGLVTISIAGIVLTARHIGVIGKPAPARPLLNFSLPLYISSGIGFFVTWVDQLLLAALLGQGALGVYSVAVRAAAVPGLFSSSIITALFPKLSELYAKQGSSSLEGAFKISTRYSVLIGFPLIVGLATLAYPMVILFGGVQYIDAAAPLIIICISALVNTFGLAIGSILLTLERTRIVSALSIASVGLSLLLSYIALVPLNLGMVGTAWARTFAAIIALGLNLYVLSRYMSISFDKEALWKASLACIVLIIAVFALDEVRMFFSSGSHQFLVFRLQLLPIYVVVAGLAYFLALIGSRALKIQDVKLVEEYLPRRLNRIVAWLERIAVAD